MNGLVLWSFVYANDRLYVGNAGHIYQSYIRLIYTNHTYESYIRMIVCVWATQVIYTNRIYDWYIQIIHTNHSYEWSFVCGQCGSYIPMKYMNHTYEWGISLIWMGWCFDHSYMRMIVCMWAMQVIYTTEIYVSYKRLLHVTKMNGLVLWSFVYANDRLYVGNAGHIYQWYIWSIHTNEAYH